MNRRSFHKLIALSAAGAATPSNGSSTAAPRSPEKEIILEDDHLLVAFGTETGALTRLVSKRTGWALQKRPAQALSFRMLVPIPGRRENYIIGTGQRAHRIEKLSPTELVIEWRDLMSQHGGVLPIGFSARVRLENGHLRFDATLHNDSEHTIETVDYPCLGDLTSPSPNAPLSCEHMWYGNLQHNELFPRFSNEKGYWGVDVPTKTFDSKRTLFCLLQARNQGFYTATHDATCPYLLQFTFEQHPGLISSLDDSVPLTQQISGHDVHLEYRFCHFVFTKPKGTRSFAPVVMQPYDGTWHSGVDIYKSWRATWFKEPHLPAWVLDIHSWQQIQVNGAEEDFRIPYKALPAYGEECARNGVKAIQLVGWNHGGQDRGDPSQDTDPGLGTREELRDAIAKIQAMGVNIILFGKLNWADLTTDWYKRELYKYECTDPYGIPYQHGGYSYYTPTQLADINKRRRAVMDFCSPGYRDLITREFRKLLDFKAAGWLFDEVCHHNPVYYSFSPDHGYEPPGYIFSGDMPLGAQLRAEADKYNPDFIFSGEGPQDWLLQYYPVSYFRINNQSRAVCRYIDPQAPLVVAVTGFDDREMLNLILLNRYVISYEPFNFKGHLSDFAPTLAYGKSIDALRRAYREYLWDATFRDTLGASISATGPVRYAVYVAKSGKRAVVLVNNSAVDAATVTVKLPNPGSLALVTPENPARQSSDGTVQLPARSAAVLLEV